jgi:succinate-semialdehyde dehydrogenase/glutarate-semialdehyde dehydrogenase
MSDTLVSTNPATGEPAGEIPVTPTSEIPKLVAKARAAQPGWAELGIDGRGELWIEIGRRLVDAADTLGQLVSDEMGKPVADARGEVKSCGAGIEVHIDEVRAAIAPETIKQGKTESVIYRDPLGVCAAITPWNFPVAMPHWMVFPALATGNTVVLKPSEETPLSAQAYFEILDAVLPDGVLQIAHGADDQGKALVADDGVDLIAFTGSREVGKKIMAAAAPGLKRLVLELGGKDPLVVLADADLEAAAKFAAGNSFRNAGQVCVSTERILVDASVADRFVDLLVSASESIEIGPMVSARQRDHVLGQIDDAVSRGARVAFGGEGHAGNFVRPTILVDVTGEMAIATEETFGPVASVTAVDSEEAAITAANAGRFGLGAVVFGGDESAARVARKLTAGMIGINKSCGGAQGTPWVGARESGYGFHSSVDGHRYFTQTRVVSRTV